MPARPALRKPTGPPWGAPPSVPSLWPVATPLSLPGTGTGPWLGHPRTRASGKEAQGCVTHVRQEPSVLGLTERLALPQRAARD